MSEVDFRAWADAIVSVAAEQLSDDGDEMAVADHVESDEAEPTELDSFFLGLTLRLKVEPDDWCSGFDHINDMDALGRVAWVEYDRCTGLAKPRPKGFDGDARKLSTQHGDAYWWQPTLKLWGVDRADWTPERIRQEVQVVRDIVDFGLSVATVEILAPCNMGCSHVIGGFSLGGIEPFPTRDYLASIVADLTREALEVAATEFTNKTNGKAA